MRRFYEFIMVLIISMVQTAILITYILGIVLLILSVFNVDFSDMFWTIVKISAIVLEGNTILTVVSSYINHQESRLIDSLSGLLQKQEETAQINQTLAERRLLHNYHSKKGRIY